MGSGGCKVARTSLRDAGVSQTEISPMHDVLYGSKGVPPTLISVLSSYDHTGRRKPFALCPLNQAHLRGRFSGAENIMLTWFEHRGELLDLFDHARNAECEPLGEP